MAVTDDDQARVVRLLLADVRATLGEGHDDIVHRHAARVREFVDDPEWYFVKVVEDTQQELHDRYIDTDWPRCPLHAGRHPLWLGAGGWRCEKAQRLIAPVGQLARLSE